MTSKPTKPDTPGLQQHAEQLVNVLSRQLMLHRQLLECIEEKRQAVRHADLDAIERLCHRENEIAQHLGELEKHRLTLVGTLTETIDPTAERPLTAVQIAAHVDDALRHRLEHTSAQLREAIAQVRKQSAVLRQAAEALAQHMAGIAHSIRAALSRAVVYGSGGQMETGAATAQRVDVKQ